MLRTAIGRLLMLCSVLPAPALGSAPPDFLSLQNYGLEDGISQLAINAIAQDDQGFVWVGTQEGLNRFDGHHFQIYYDVLTNAQGVSTSSVNALAVDARARLWIGTDDAGLAVRDLRSGSVATLGVNPGQLQVAVQEILLTEDGGAWLGTEVEIVRVDAELKIQQRQSSAEIVGIAALGPSLAYALDARCGLWRLTPKGPEPVASPAPSSEHCVGLQSAGNQLWLGTAQQGLYRLNAEGETLSHYSADSIRAESAELSTILVTRENQLYLAFADGLLFAADLDTPWSPHRVWLDQTVGSAISRLMESEAGVLWLGSETRGLFRSRTLSAAVRRDLLSQLGISDWSKVSVRSLWGDDARWLVGTDQGLLWRTGEHADWQRVSSIGLTSVRKILPAKGGGWWIGTHRGVWHLAEDGQAKALAGLSNELVTDMLLEGDTLWVATRGGLARYVSEVLSPNALTDKLDGLFLTCLMRDEQQRLWIGSDDTGVFRVAADGGVEHLHVGNGRLKQNSVWSISQTDSAFWLGTFGGGLNRIDRTSEALTQISRAQGLSNDVIYRIEPDAQGRLWMSSNRGLNVYDPASGETRVLSTGDGLSNREFNSGASFRDAKGLMYFGGTESIDIIEPTSLESASPEARPVFTSLRILGRRGQERASSQDHQQRELEYASEVSLDYRESVFSLGLVALEFSAPESARLRYRIHGIHNDWVRPDQPRTELLLSYLPPGDYELEAQAAGHVGQFGKSRSLKISVGAPPWRQPWAYVGYAAVLLAALAWLVSRIGASARAKRAQIAQLNRIVAERTAELERANDLLRRSNKELERASRVDPLTQVSNRRDLQPWLEEQVELFTHGARGDERLLFCIIDIDDFKAINDHYGHQAGDEVLVSLAGRLNQLCRDQDVVIRWGGEEFLVLVRSTGVAFSAQIAERIHKAVADRPFILESGKSLVVTCSIGFAPWPMLKDHPTASGCEQSINLADRALYAAKGAGKNAWVGVVPTQALDEHNLAKLLAGTSPTELPAGSVDLLYSTPMAPEFPDAGRSL